MRRRKSMQMKKTRQSTSKEEEENVQAPIVSEDGSTQLTRSFDGHLIRIVGSPRELRPDATTTENFLDKLKEAYVSSGKDVPEVMVVGGGSSKARNPHLMQAQRAALKAKFDAKLQRRLQEGEALLLREYEQKRQDLKRTLTERYRSKFEVEWAKYNLKRGLRSKKVTPLKRRSAKTASGTVIGQDKIIRDSRGRLCVASTPDPESLESGEDALAVDDESGEYESDASDSDLTVTPRTFRLSTSIHNSSDHSASPSCDPSPRGLLKMAPRDTGTWDEYIAKQPVQEGFEELCVIRCQRVIRRWLARRLYKRHKRRCKVVHELVETESNYFRSLLVLQQGFLMPLLKHAKENRKPILDAMDIVEVFGNLDAIVGINKPLVRELNETYKRWNVDSCIGYIFLGAPHRFMRYGTYLGCFQRALGTLRKLRSDPHIDEFISTMEVARLHSGAKLRDYLIQPIQRIPRYEILLQEVIRFTPESHPDYAGLKVAFEHVRLAAQQVDEISGLVENSWKLSELQQSLLTPPGTEKIYGLPLRRLLKEGRMTDVTRERPKKRHLILMNDCIIITRAMTPKEDAKPDTVLQAVRRFVYLKDIQAVHKAVMGRKAAIFLRLKSSSILGFVPPSDKDASIWLSKIEGALADEHAPHPNAPAVRHRRALLAEIPITLSAVQGYEFLCVRARSQRRRSSSPAPTPASLELADTYRRNREAKLEQVKVLASDVASPLNSGSLSRYASSIGGSPRLDSPSPVLSRSSSPVNVRDRMFSSAPPSISEPPPPSKPTSKSSKSSKKRRSRRLGASKTVNERSLKSLLSPRVPLDKLPVHDLKRRSPRVLTSGDLAFSPQRRFQTLTTKASSKQDRSMEMFMGPRPQHKSSSNLSIPSKEHNLTMLSLETLQEKESVLVKEVAGLSDKLDKLSAVSAQIMSSHSQVASVDRILLATKSEMASVGLTLTDKSFELEVIRKRIAVLEGTVKAEVEAAMRDARKGARERARKNPRGKNGCVPNQQSCVDRLVLSAGGDGVVAAAPESSSSNNNNSNNNNSGSRKRKPQQQ